LPLGSGRVLYSCDVNYPSPLFPPLSSLPLSPSNTIASLFLIYTDTLMSQIEDTVRKEKRKQAWVPIPGNGTSDNNRNNDFYFTSIIAIHFT